MDIIITGIGSLSTGSQNADALFESSINSSVETQFIDIQSHEGIISIPVNSIEDNLINVKGLKQFNKLDRRQKIDTLAMIAPITNEEKQKLLESLSLKQKVQNLEEIINFYLHEIEFNTRTIQ